MTLLQQKGRYPGDRVHLCHVDFPFLLYGTSFSEAAVGTRIQPNFQTRGQPSTLNTIRIWQTADSDTPGRFLAANRSRLSNNDAKVDGNRICGNHRIPGLGESEGPSWKKN